MDKKLLIWLFNQGYQYGHHDTVEGQFTDVHPDDIDSYNADIVQDLVFSDDGYLAEKDRKEYREGNSRG